MNKKVLACALASFVATQSTPACRNVSAISGGRIALNVVSGGVEAVMTCFAVSSILEKCKSSEIDKTDVLIYTGIGSVLGLDALIKLIDVVYGIKERIK